MKNVNFNYLKDGGLSHTRFKNETNNGNKSHVFENSTSCSTPNNLLTIKEVSDWLKISVKSIYNMIYRDKIPHLKIGKLLRFNEAEIEGWLSSCKKEVTNVN